MSEVRSIELKEELERFRVAFPLTRVSHFANCLIYKVGLHTSDASAKQANDKIKELGLNLFAQSTAFITRDSFIVKKKS